MKYLHVIQLNISPYIADNFSKDLTKAKVHTSVSENNHTFQNHYFLNVEINEHRKITSNTFYCNVLK